MSIIICEKCGFAVDTDNNPEHFDDEVNGCEVMFEKKQDYLSAKVESEAEEREKEELNDKGVDQAVEENQFSK